jgi:hypothetical protein
VCVVQSPAQQFSGVAILPSKLRQAVLQTVTVGRSACACACRVVPLLFVVWLLGLVLNCAVVVKMRSEEAHAVTPSTNV